MKSNETTWQHRKLCKLCKLSKLSCRQKQFFFLSKKEVFCCFSKKKTQTTFGDSCTIRMLSFFRRSRTQWTLLPTSMRFMSTITKAPKATTTIPSFQNDHLRYNMPLFYGAMGNEDELNKQLSTNMRNDLLEIQKTAQEAVEARDKKQFVKQAWDPFNLASASSHDIADWTKKWEASEGRVGVADDVETLLDRKILIPNSDGQFTFGVPNYYATMVKKIPRVFLSHATKDGTQSEALRKRLELRGVCVITMEQIEAQVVMIEQSIPSWMDDHTTRQGQHTLFLLGDAFMEQLNKGDFLLVEIS